MPWDEPTCADTMKSPSYSHVVAIWRLLRPYDVWISTNRQMTQKWNYDVILKGSIFCETTVKCLNITLCKSPDDLIFMPIRECLQRKNHDDIRVNPPNHYHMRVRMRRHCNATWWLVIESNSIKKNRHNEKIWVVWE